MRTLSLLAIIISLLSFTLPNEQGLSVGDKAVDFKLKNVDGKMVSLADYKDDKGVVVVFTCNHCPFAIAYEDRLIALDKKYKKKGFPVVAINPNDVSQKPDDSYEGMVTRAKEKGFTFPYLHDETQDIAKAYGAVRTPHAFLLQNDGSGNFTVAYIGAIDDDAQNQNVKKDKFIEKAIQALDSGKQPDPNFTKAIGCTVKWKR